MPYGDRWRQQRRLFQRYLDPQAIQAFRPIKQLQVQALLQDLLSSPDDFINGVKRYDILPLYTQSHFEFFTTYKQVYVVIVFEGRVWRLRDIFRRQASR